MAPPTTSLRPEEEWVRQMMEAELGEPVVAHDDGSRPSMHDLDVRPRVGETHAVEVTADADQDCVELWKLVNGGGRRIEPSLAGGWMVSLETTARKNRLDRELVPFLENLETHGIDNYRPLRRDALTVEARRLGIRSAHRSTTSFPGSVYFTISQPRELTGGFVQEDPTAVAIWMTDFAARDAQSHNLAKLASSDRPRRHLFVLLAGFTTAPFGVTYALMADGMPTPTVDPELPSELTDFWVASTWVTGAGFRWSRNSGWHRFDKLQPI